MVRWLPLKSLTVSKQLKQFWPLHGIISRIHGQFVWALGPCAFRVGVSQVQAIFSMVCSPFNGFVKGHIQRNCGLVLRISAIQPLYWVTFLKRCLKMLMLHSFPRNMSLLFPLCGVMRHPILALALRPPCDLLAYKWLKLALGSKEKYQKPKWESSSVSSHLQYLICFTSYFQHLLN